MKKKKQYNILKKIMAVMLVCVATVALVIGNTSNAKAATSYSNINTLRNYHSGSGQIRLHSNGNEGRGENWRRFADSYGRSACPVYKLSYNLDGDSAWWPMSFNGQSVKGEGGYEIKIKVDGTEVWYGKPTYRDGEDTSDGYTDEWKGIRLSDLYFTPITLNGITFLQVNIELTNTNPVAKTISLATGGDIQIADDDNAAIQYLGNGFSMSNRYCETSTTYGGTVKSATLNVYAKGNPFVTDADALYVGEFGGRCLNIWNNNVLGNTTTHYNFFKHGGKTGANSGLDTAFEISWQNRYITAGETQTYKYIIGAGEYNPNNTLTFDANGGSLKYPGGNINNPNPNCNSTNQVTVTFGSANYCDMSGDIPVRAGYDFAGWWTTKDNTGTEVYDSNGSCKKGTAYWDSNSKWKGFTDLTLYAHWTASSNTPYKVEHYKQTVDGTYADTPDETESKTGTTGSEVTPSVKTYTGFTSPSAQKATIAADGSTVVKYYYKRNNYSLTFNWDIGVSGVTGHDNNENDIGINKNKAYSYTYGKTEPSFIFFNNGYEFDYVEEKTPGHEQNHWSNDGTGTDNYGRFYLRENWSIQAYNRTFYIHTKPKIYKLRLYANGGTIPDTGNMGKNSDCYLSSDKTNGYVPVTYTMGWYNNINADNPSREGYTFNGWYLDHFDSNGNVIKTEQIYDGDGHALESSVWHWDNSTGWHYQIAGDVSLYAGWTRNSYYLDLNANYYDKDLNGLKTDNYDLGICDVIIYDDDGNVYDKATGVTDYYKKIPYGYTYEITNFKLNPGYAVIDKGNLKGSIKAEEYNRVYPYIVDKYGLSYYDGNGNTDGQLDYFNNYSLRTAYEQSLRNRVTEETVKKNIFVRNNASFLGYKTEDGNLRYPDERIISTDNYKGVARIKSASSLDSVAKDSMVFNIAGDNYNSGTNIQLFWDAKGSSTSTNITAQSENWVFVPADDGYWYIVSAACGKVVDLLYANASDFANIQLENFNGSNAQQWKLEPAGDGYYYISTKVNEDYRIDWSGSNTDFVQARGNVCIYHAIDYACQMWKIDFLDREDYFQVQWADGNRDLSATRFIEYHGNNDDAGKGDDGIYDDTKYLYGYDATDDKAKVEKDLFYKTGYTLTHYNTSADDSNNVFYEGDVIPLYDKQGITKIKIRGINQVLYNPSSEDVSLISSDINVGLGNQWSFVCTETNFGLDATGYIVNQETGRALTANGTGLKATKLDKDNENQLWTIEIDAEAEGVRIYSYSSNRYISFNMWLGLSLSPYSDSDYQICSIDGINTKLYAQWKANKYTVTFDYNKPENAYYDVTGKVNKKTVTYDSAYGNAYEPYAYKSLPNPSLNGWSFKGWYTKKDGGTLVTEEIIVKTPNNHTLYAHWEHKSFDNGTGFTINYWTENLYKGNNQNNGYSDCKQISKDTTEYYSNYKTVK